METSTKNTLIKTIIPSTVTLIVGIAGIFVADNAISTINNNKNVNSNSMVVTFADGTIRTYSEDDIKILEANMDMLDDKVATLEDENKELLSSGYRNKKYENIKIILDGIQMSENDKYSIMVVDGVNYYSEEILKGIGNVNISFEQKENTLYVNQK